MGGRQSKRKLENELASMKEQAALAQRKHEDELEAMRRDKRELEFKLGVLQELTAQAQLDAERATQTARESEERMRALKWELVRKLTVSTTSPTASLSSSPTHTPSTSSTLAASESGSPRVALNWKLRDGVALHRANTTVLSIGLTSAGTGVKQRPHAQSEPVMPQAQVLQRHRELVTKQKDPIAAAAAIICDDSTTSTRSSIDNSSSSRNERELEHKASATAVRSVALGDVSSSSSFSSASASSSEDEVRKPASKFPPLSRKKPARGSAATAPSESESSASEQSEPESEAKAKGTGVTRVDIEGNEAPNSKRGVGSRESRGDVLAFSSEDDESS